MRRIVLIAHDAKKEDMLEWLLASREDLVDMELVTTRSTGEEVVAKAGLPATLLPGGPEAGDETVRGMIEEGLVDLVVFFWDPRSPQPREVDVDRLFRLAVVHDVPTALNPWTADFFLSELHGGRRRTAGIFRRHGRSGRRTGMDPAVKCI